MATPKKKHLIELMIEAGVKWPDGAEYAAQDKRNGKLYFFKMKPRVRHGDEHFCAPGGSMGYPYSLPSLCRNWHETIVTREQYAEAVSAAATMTPAAQQEAQPAPKYCASVMRQMPNNTIEQLTSDYHTKAAEADRLQSVADEALKAADDALLALEKAGELLGLVVSIDTKPKHAEQQCSSAKWKTGDKCIVTDSPDDADFVGRECVIIEIDAVDNELPYRVSNQWDWELWVSGIRRP